MIRKIEEHIETLLESDMKNGDKYVFTGVALRPDIVFGNSPAITFFDGDEVLEIVDALPREHKSSSVGNVIEAKLISTPSGKISIKNAQGEKEYKVDGQIVLLIPKFMNKFKKIGE